MTRWPSASFLFGLVVLAPDYAAAQVQCDLDHPKHCAAVVVKGEKAPISGQLLSNELALSLSFKADRCDARVEMEVDFAERQKDLDIDLLKDLRANDAERHELELGAMQADRDRWKELAAIPFYEKSWFVATTTVIVVGAIFVGASRIPGR